MIQFLKSLKTITQLLLAMLLVPMLITGSAYAVDASCGTGSNSASDQTLQSVQQTSDSNNKCDDGQVNNSIQIVLNILSLVAGILGIIVIVIAGFKYITSGGDSNKVGSAKNTLIYAAIGLAIAALAQVIVYVVINSSHETITKCETNEKILQSDDNCPKNPNRYK